MLKRNKILCLTFLSLLAGLSSLQHAEARECRAGLDTIKYIDLAKSTKKELECSTVKSGKDSCKTYGASSKECVCRRLEASIDCLSRNPALMLKGKVAVNPDTNEYECVLTKAEHFKGGCEHEVNAVVEGCAALKTCSEKLSSYSKLPHLFPL